jgi:glycosyltransferase involved in cell wall biosynthesis
MIDNRKICVVLPAYYAARTLKETVREILADIVDDVILVDDASTDDTIQLANKLGVLALRLDRNRGYGGNQKTC